MVFRSLVAALLRMHFLVNRPLRGLVQASERRHTISRLLLRVLQQIRPAHDLLDLNRCILRLLRSLNVRHLALEHVDVVLEALECDENDGEVVQ